MRPFISARDTFKLSFARLIHSESFFHKWIMIDSSFVKMVQKTKNRLCNIVCYNNTWKIDATLKCEEISSSSGVNIRLRI